MPTRVRRQSLIIKHCPLRDWVVHTSVLAARRLEPAERWLPGEGVVEVAHQPQIRAVALPWPSPRSALGLWRTSRRWRSSRS